MQIHQKVLCSFIILMLLLYPVIAESATGNISGRIVSTSGSTSGSTITSTYTTSWPPASGGGGGGGLPLFNSTFSTAFVTSRYIYERNKATPLKLSETYTNATDIINVSIVVNEPIYIDFRFANVIRLPNIEMPENAYRVYEFVFTKFGSRTKVEPKNAIVIFRVSSDWVKRAEDVKLFEYENNTWSEHPTEMLGSGDGYTYYRSSFNHSGFYYLGYAEVNERVDESLLGNAENTIMKTNETTNSSVAENLTEGSSSVNHSVSQNLTSPTPTVIQESLVGSILNDILEFVSNLIHMIGGFLGL